MKFELIIFLIFKLLKKNEQENKLCCYVNFFHWVVIFEKVV